MPTRTLPIRTVVIPACWPFSGKNYEVWERGKCILSTNSKSEAEDKASEV